MKKPFLGLLAHAEPRAGMAVFTVCSDQGSFWSSTWRETGANVGGRAYSTNARRSVNQTTSTEMLPKRAISISPNLSDVNFYSHTLCSLTKNHKEQGAVIYKLSLFVCLCGQNTKYTKHCLTPTSISLHFLLKYKYFFVLFLSKYTISYFKCISF